MQPIDFYQFWEVLLYSGKDIRLGEAHELYDNYVSDYAKKIFEKEISYGRTEKCTQNCN